MTICVPQIDLTASEGEAVRLTAAFWQSPFAVASGLVLTFQLIIYGYAALRGTPLPVDVLWPLTAVSTMILTAGLWPDWNYLDVSSEGVHQHAGLTYSFIPWTDIKRLDAGLSGVTVTYFEKVGDTPKRRQLRLVNRYGVSSDGMRALIEARWQHATRLTLH